MESTSVAVASFLVALGALGCGDDAEGAGGAGGAAATETGGPFALTLHLGFHCDSVVCEGVEFAFIVRELGTLRRVVWQEGVVTAGRAEVHLPDTLESGTSYEIIAQTFHNSDCASRGSKTLRIEPAVGDTELDVDFDLATDPFNATPEACKALFNGAALEPGEYFADYDAEGVFFFTRFSVTETHRLFLRDASLEGPCGGVGMLEADSCETAREVFVRADQTFSLYFGTSDSNATLHGTIDGGLSLAADVVVGSHNTAETCFQAQVSMVAAPEDYQPLECSPM